MKKSLLLVPALLAPVALNSQAPYSFNYQAVIRNSDGTVKTDEAITIQIDILQGNIEGTSVYQEIHDTTTNSIGMVILEIGHGSSTQEFSDIDWSQGPYFIDISVNGISIGITQLLSVPYALYAGTVESIEESDPAYYTSQATKITEKDIINLGNLYGVNTGVQDLSGLALQSALEDTASEIRNHLREINTYSVRDFGQGGVVFWVDNDGRHGLVCDRKNLTEDMRWYAGTYGITRATGDGLFSGEANTIIIISSHAAIGDDSDPYAALICNELKVEDSGITYGDWYLPSIGELKVMYQNKTAIDPLLLQMGVQRLVTNGCGVQRKSFTTLHWSFTSKMEVWRSAQAEFDFLIHLLETKKES